MTGAPGGAARARGGQTVDQRNFNSGPFSRRAARARPGFTLLEAVMVVAIIATLVALLLVGVARALRSARLAAERQLIGALKIGVEDFKQQFGFYPPLVNDAAPGPIDAMNNPVIRDGAFLRYETLPNEPRFSTYSLPYYLIGALGAEVDGVKGPGFTTVKDDGSFERRGPSTGPKVDMGKDPSRFVFDPGDPQRHKVQIMDRWGNAIRYYRWEHTVFENRTDPRYGQVKMYNVPAEVGDPVKNVSLRSAEFAILSLGPDQLANPTDPAAPENADNIVETGP